MTTLPWVIHLFTVGYYVFPNFDAAIEWLEERDYGVTVYRSIENNKGENIGTLAQAKEHSPLAIPPVPHSKQAKVKIHFYSNETCLPADRFLVSGELTRDSARRVLLANDYIMVCQEPGASLPYDAYRFLDKGGKHYARLVEFI